MGILWTIVIGFVAGFIAKFVMPGPNEPTGFVLTTVLGIVGAFVATGFHAGDYRVGVMADPARPGLVTTDLGLDRLWNRTITLLAGATVIAACIYGALLSLIRNRRAA